MRVGRRNHTATLLPSGKVLVTGGQTEDESVLASAEVYDPDLGTWSPAKPMHETRHLHTATRLASGRILVTGGRSDPSGSSRFIAMAEEYDPIAEDWIRIEEPMSTGRDKHSATLLPSGKVLVAGGQGDRQDDLKSAAVYDPGSQNWSPTTSEVNAARFWHTATLLLSGKVLLAGGSKVGSEDGINNAEVYDELPAVPQVTSPTPNELYLDTWKPRIAGTAEPNSTVEVSLDEADPIQVSANDKGAWCYEPDEPLGIGSHTLSAKAIDRAGNVSEAAPPVTFEMIDRSHYGWSCSSTSAFPTTEIILVVLGLIYRRVPVRDRVVWPSR
jgi:hypothetical protein